MTNKSKIKVYLYRVGIDTTYGGIVSPFFSNGLGYVFIPLLSKIRKKTNYAIPYFEVKTNNKRINLMNWLPCDHLKRPRSGKYPVKNAFAHNDPEFETITFGHYKWFNHIKELKLDWEKNKYKDNRYFLFFYAGFYETNPEDYYCNYTLKDLSKKFKKRLQYRIYAYMELKYPPIYSSNYKKYEREIRKNPHYLSGDIGEEGQHIFVGKRGGWLKGKIRIDDNFKIIKSNYQINPEFKKFLEKRYEKRKSLNKLYVELKPNFINYVEEKEGIKLI